MPWASPTVKKKKKAPVPQPVPQPVRPSTPDQPDIEVGRYALRTFQGTYSGGELRSLFQDHTWDNGVAIAKCLKNKSKPKVVNWGGDDIFPVPEPEHDAPDENCECGLYGTLTLDHLLRDYRDRAAKCVVVFAAEGVTFIGNRGLRTAAARIVAYWTAPPVAAVPDGPDELGMGPFWRAGVGYLHQPAQSEIGEVLKVLKDPVRDTFATQCPDAKYFPDIHEMLKAYGFPEYHGEFPPTVTHIRERPPKPPRKRAPGVQQLPAVIGKWSDIAPLMAGATPGGIAAVKKLLGDLGVLGA